MKSFKLSTLLLIIIFVLPSYASEFGSISSEKSRLLKRIQCARQSNTPAGNGLGSLWGCYNRSEDIKLWINGEASKISKVRNIKLSVVNYHGSKMDITGRIWAGIIAEEYGGKNAQAIKDNFQNCPIKKSIDSGALTISINCSKGPQADEHTIIVKPK